LIKEFDFFYDLMSRLIGDFGFFRDLMPRLIEEFDIFLRVNEMLSVMLIRDTYKMDDVRSAAIRTYHTSKKITQSSKQGSARDI
jgi:hypothetical protein